MPSSAEAEEDKRRKVSGSAAPPQFLERPSALIQNPGTHPDTDADLLHPHSCPPQAALLEVKGWVEGYIPAEHLLTRSCVVDVQEVRRESDHTPHRSARRRSRPRFSCVRRAKTTAAFFLAACNRLTRRPESIPRESSLPGPVRRPRLRADRHDRAHHLRTPVRHGVRNSVRGVGSETRRRREHDAAA